MMSKCKIFFHKTLLGQIFGFRPTFEFSSTLDKCISGPQRWGHERRPKRQVGFPKKATTFQDFGSLALTSLTARLIGLSGCLLLQNGLDCQRKIKVIFSWLEVEKTVSLTCQSVSSHLQRPLLDDVTVLHSLLHEQGTTMWSDSI